MTGFRITKADTIAQCNAIFSRKTLHPLVSLIELRSGDCCTLLQTGFYSVLLVGSPSMSCSGWDECDFSEGILSFIPPGGIVNLDACGGCLQRQRTLLCIHPGLFDGVRTGNGFTGDSFFRYRNSEALHLSCCELGIIRKCMEGIGEELLWDTDEYSATIIVEKIGLLLEYSRRFYKRQFITRHEKNIELIAKADCLAEKYFLSGQAVREGMPTADYFGRMLGLSPAYFEDMLKCETGRSVPEYIGDRQFGIACRQLRQSGKSVADIAKELGYTSLRNFCSTFRRLTGCTPTGYRTAN